MCSVWLECIGINFPYSQLSPSTPKSEARTRHSISLIPAHWTFLKKQFALQNSSKYVLLDSYRESEMSIQISLNRDLQNSLQQLQHGNVSHYHPTQLNCSNNTGILLNMGEASHPDVTLCESSSMEHMTMWPSREIPT